MFEIPIRQGRGEAFAHFGRNTFMTFIANASPLQLLCSDKLLVLIDPQEIRGTRLPDGHTSGYDDPFPLRDIAGLRG